MGVFKVIPKTISVPLIRVCGRIKRDSKKEALLLDIGRTFDYRQNKKGLFRLYRPHCKLKTLEIVDEAAIKDFGEKIKYNKKYCFTFAPLFKIYDSTTTLCGGFMDAEEITKDKLNMSDEAASFNDFSFKKPIFSVCGRVSLKMEKSGSEISGMEIRDRDYCLERDEGRMRIYRSRYEDKNNSVWDSIKTGDLCNFYFSPSVYTNGGRTRVDGGFVGAKIIEEEEKISTNDI